MIHENDALTTEELAEIEKMRPDHRLRALVEHRKFAQKRQARRDAQATLQASGAGQYLEAQVFAAEVAAWSMRPDVLAVAKINPEFRKRVDALRDRTGGAVLAAASIVQATPAPARRGYENIDPTEFARRVQIRRRMAALRSRRSR